MKNWSHFWCIFQFCYGILGSVSAFLVRCGKDDFLHVMEWVKTKTKIDLYEFLQQMYIGIGRCDRRDDGIGLLQYYFDKKYWTTWTGISLVVFRIIEHVRFSKMTVWLTVQRRRSDWNDMHSVGLDMIAAWRMTICSRNDMQNISNEEGILFQTSNIHTPLGLIHQSRVQNLHCRYRKWTKKIDFQSGQLACKSWFSIKYVFM